MLVGLRLMPNVLQGAWWSHSWHNVVAFANNSWTRSFALGYWLFYFSTAFDSDEETNASSEYVCCLIYPCPYWGQSIFVTVSSYIVLNQLIAGSIMVSEANEINTCIVFAFKSRAVHTHFFLKNDCYWTNLPKNNLSIECLWCDTCG